MRLGYQPALDGLRGATIWVIVVFHAGYEATFPGAYLALESFFVLSGFLITALLLTEWDASGTIRLGRFWSRRARRLLPALLLVLVFVAAYAALAAHPDELGSLRSDSLATLGYAANWNEVLAGHNYWDQFKAPSPLLHTWSLAVEEQWYLVWPLLALALLRFARLGHRGMVVACGALAFGSAALMGALYDPARLGRVYHGTDTRAQALLVGAGLAFLLAHHGSVRSRTGRVALQVAGVMGLAVMVAVWFVVPHTAQWLYRGGFLAHALVCAVVVAAAVQSTGPLRAVLSVGALCWLGKLAYGLYLWHLPVMVWLDEGRTGLDGAALLVARLTVTMALVLASYYLVELPIRSGGLRAWRSWTVTPAAIAGVVLLAVVATAGGRPAVVVAGAAEPPPLPAAPEPAPGEPPATPPVTVLVVGDSMAVTLAGSVNAGGLARTGLERRMAVWNAGQIGCGVTLDDVYVDGDVVKPAAACRSWPERWSAHVAEFDPDLAVVLVGGWDLFDRRVDGARRSFGADGDADERLGAELLGAVDVLGARGATVALLTVPYFWEEDETVIGPTLRDPRSRLDPARVDRYNRLLSEVVGASGGRAVVVDLASVANANPAWRPDGAHYSVPGAEAAATALLPHLSTLVSSA